MSIPSFMSLTGLHFEAASFRVYWHESSPEDGTYVLDLRQNMRLYLAPTDALEVLTKLAMVMLGRGETIGAAQLAIEEAKARIEAVAAEQRQWDELGADAKAVRA
jgi:hypothetical protein